MIGPAFDGASTAVRYSVICGVGIRHCGREGDVMRIDAHGDRLMLRRTPYGPSAWPAGCHR
jgi:hypothetical protein